MATTTKNARARSGIADLAENHETLGSHAIAAAPAATTKN